MLHLKVLFKKFIYLYAFRFIQRQVLHMVSLIYIQFTTV